MKIYIDFSKQAITKVDNSVAYVGDVYSNVFELLFFNYGVATDWFPTMSQLAPNGREAGDFSADALVGNETYNYVEDGVTYKRYKFTIGDGWVKMKGRSNFFIWVNKLVDSSASLQRKCYGKLNVALNESTDNYFIQDPYFNPKIKEYIDNTIGDDLETYKATIDDEVESQNETIASLIQASPSVFDTASNIGNLQENKGVAVATDTGYIYYWDSTLATPAYVSSGLVYNEPEIADGSIHLTKLNADVIEYIDEQGKPTQQQVDNWLDEHPEATTTVENHSLSQDKLIVGTLGFVNPEMFGAVGDGITDDTAAFTSCLAYKNIELKPNKIYLISASLTIVDDTVIKGNNSTLKFTNVQTNIDEQAVDGACIYITGNNITLKDINFVGDNTWIRRPYTWEDNFATWYNLRVRTKALFVINNCDSLFVDNLNSKGFRNQLVLRNTTNFKINNCYVSETLADGFFIGYGCSNGIITNCQGEKTDDDFISITADGRYTDLPPHDIIADGNRCVNCWGAYFCTEGSYNISCLNGFASDIHFKPLKFGEFNVSGVVINSGLQTFSNITVLLSETMQGDNNNTLESVACGLGANVDIMLDNVTFIKPLDSKTMMFYINGGKVTLKNSTFTGGSWWFRALTLLNLDNNTFNPNGKINFTGDNAIIKNNIFNKDFSTYTGIIEINTTNATFIKNTFIGYTTTYPITSSSTTLVYEGIESVDANSAGTIKNDTISTSARLAPSKMLSGFVFSNSKLYACIGGNKYVITMTYES